MAQDVEWVHSVGNGQDTEPQIVPDGSASSLHDRTQSCVSTCKVWAFLIHTQEREHIQSFRCQIKEGRQHLWLNTTRECIIMYWSFVENPETSPVFRHNHTYVSLCLSAFPCVFLFFSTYVLFHLSIMFISCPLTANQFWSGCAQYVWACVGLCVWEELQ